MYWSINSGSARRRGASWMLPGRPRSPCSGNRGWSWERPELSLPLRTSPARRRPSLPANKFQQTCSGQTGAAAARREAFKQHARRQAEAGEPRANPEARSLSRSPVPSCALVGAPRASAGAAGTGWTCYGGSMRRTQPGS